MTRKKYPALPELDKRLSEAFIILQVYDDSRLEALLGEADLCDAFREGASLKCSMFHGVAVSKDEVKDLAAKILKVRKEDVEQG